MKFEYIMKLPIRLLPAFTLHTLVVARSSKLPAGFEVVKNNLLLTEYV